jgi:hypothetical protein
MRGQAVQKTEIAPQPARPAPIDKVVHAAAVQEEKTLETAPRTGVEVIAVEARGDERYYTMRDLRNGNVVKNVTLKSARRLWHYAITTFDDLPADLSKAQIHWQGKYGLIRRQKHGKGSRYDLIERTGNGSRYYFGVTEDGIHGSWKGLVGLDED